MNEESNPGAGAFPAADDFPQVELGPQLEPQPRAHPEADNEAIVVPGAQPAQSLFASMTLEEKLRVLKELLDLFLPKKMDKREQRIGNMLEGARKLEPELLLQLLDNMANANALKKKIKGSTYENMFWTTLAFFVGFGAVTVLSTAMADAENLDKFFLALTLNLPTVLGSLLRLPGGVDAAQWGGKRSILAFMASNVVGLGIIAGTVTAVDIKTLTADRLAYWVLNIGAFIAGPSIAVFAPGAALTGFWSRGNVGRDVNLYAAGNHGAWAWMLALRQLAKVLGLPATFGIWAAGTALFTLLLANREQPDVYHQLKRFGLPHESAELLAREGWGQVRFPPADIDKKRMDQAMRKQLLLCKNPKVLAMMGGYAQFGVFLAATTTMVVHLKLSYGAPLDLAVGLASAFSGGSSGIRSAAGGLIAKYDPSGGVWTTEAANYLSGLGGAMIAIGGLIDNDTARLWLAIVGYVAMMFGTGVANAADFVAIPKHGGEQMAQIMGLVGAAGALLGPILGISMGAVAKFVEKNGMDVAHALIFVISVAAGVGLRVAFRNARQLKAEQEAAQAQPDGSVNDEAMGRSGSSVRMAEDTPLLREQGRRWMMP